MSKALAVYELPAAKLEVYRDKVIFARKGIRNVTNAKIVYLQDITSVELKEPTLLSAGYIQVNFAGKSLSGDPDAGKDEYSIPISFKGMMPRAIPVWKCMNKLLDEQKKMARTSQLPPFSVADEILKLKELCDKGILTEDEFIAKKKQLLNL